MKPFLDLDVDSIKEKFIEFLKNSDSQFKDYNFDGSAISSLIDILSYSNRQQNFYLNMAMNDMFLKNTEIRRNAISLAKSLNYEPSRRLGTKVVINISAIEPVAGSTISIPKNTVFECDAKPYIVTDNVFLNDLNEFTSEIELKQNEVKEEIFSFDLNQSFTLQYGDEIDDEFLDVYVDNEKWELFSDISINGDSKVYFIEHNFDGKIEITFGDNVFGKRPDIGNTIKIVYGITDGKLSSSKVTEVKLSDIVTDDLNNTYTDGNFSKEISSFTLGIDEESIDSIKLFAPKFYETQNRTVTSNDYINILNRLPFIEKVNVWSGVDNIPPVYGSVFFTVKPKDSETLTDDQIQEIKDYHRKYQLMSIELKYVEPFFINIDIESVVKYYKDIGISTVVLKNNIQNEIENYFSDGISSFDSMFKFSKLTESIDSVYGVSNNLTNIKPFIKFDANPTNSFYFRLYNEIKEGSIVNDYIYDMNGKILRKDDDFEVGTLDYTKGIFNFSTTMDSVDNKVYFDTGEMDINFLLNIMIRLNDISIEFKGI
jgi:hypothetical protein